MAKKQNSSEVVAFLLLFTILLISFLLFVPKVVSTLFPFKREMILQNFLQATQQAKTISPQQFWQFREFYSPGFYTFNRNGIEIRTVRTAENKIGLHIVTNPDTITFLTFTSPHLVSIEALVTTDTLARVVNIESIQKASIVLAMPNETIVKDTKGNTYIIFLKSISAMKTANGFFNYTDADKSLVEGKYLLDITMLDEQ